MKTKVVPRSKVSRGDRKEQKKRKRIRNRDLPPWQKDLHVLIDGNLTHYPSGWCHSKRHMGFLTPGLVDTHHCIEKGCPFYRDYIDGVIQDRTVEKGDGDEISEVSSS